MTFDEFHPGQRLTDGPATISEAEILAFANAYDPQWFHADVERARAGRWKGLIASGWHTCSIAMRLVVDGALRGSESFGSPGSRIPQVAGTGSPRRCADGARRSAGRAPVRAQS